jgi:superfamily II DNA/RNA helicase
MDEILLDKQVNDMPPYDYARAMVLVPNKELVQQVARMAVSLGGEMIGAGVPPTNTTNSKETVRIAIMPGGLHEPQDFKPFRDSIGLGGKNSPVDIVLSTPASVGPLGLKPKYLDLFADIGTLVLDEADMLLDGGYIQQLGNVLMGFKRADRVDATNKTQHVFVAATLPDMGLRSVDAFLVRKFPNATRVAMKGMHSARHSGLKQTTVWIEQENKKRRMEELVSMLVETSVTDGGLKGEKVMVFLNSVDDVDGACEALVRSRVKALPYHAKIKLDDRTVTLDRFRRYNKLSDTYGADDDTAPVLVCTDLASRGLDIPGVDAVVQLQFAGNVVAHLHRMGRCGRAGQRTGRCIVFYGEQEKELIEVVRKAEDAQERMVLDGDVPDIDEMDDTSGKVDKAFSRRRGFTKKRKKERKVAFAAGGESNDFTD